MSASEVVNDFGKVPIQLQNKVFELGDCIVSAAPFAHVISMKCNGNFCDWCANPPSDSSRLLKCSACGYEHYCNKQCQRKAWKYHKFECPLLKARMPKIPADSVRLLTKIIWSLHRNVSCAENDPGWRNYYHLCSHTEKIVTDTTRTTQYSEVLFTLQKYLGEQFAVMVPDTSKLLAIFGRMIFNGFTLVQMGQEIGAGVYTSPSVFDHSCAPNACHITIGTTVEVRALRRIDTSKEPVLVNYIDPMVPRSERQATLMKDYFFECKCSKCEDINGEAILEGVLCPYCGGNASRKSDNSVKCRDCCKVIDDDFYLKKCDAAAQKAWSLSQNALKCDNMDEVKTFLSKNAVLPQSNIHIESLLVTMYAYESQFGNDRKAYDMGEKLTAVFKKHYPEYFPMHGEHQFKQARLAWHLDFYDAALQHYERGLKLLRLTHGPNHIMTKMAITDAAECKRDKVLYEHFNSIST